MANSHAKILNKVGANQIQQYTKRIKYHSQIGFISGLQRGFNIRKMKTKSDNYTKNLGSKITADGDCSHEIKRHLLLGRKVMTNLDSIFKSRDITLPTKVHLVKAMVFPVVMYGCES